ASQTEDDTTTKVREFEGSRVRGFSNPRTVGPWDPWTPYNPARVLPRVATPASGAGLYGFRRRLARTRRGCHHRDLLGGRLAHRRTARGSQRRSRRLHRRLRRVLRTAALVAIDPLSRGLHRPSAGGRHLEKRCCVRAVLAGPCYARA